jgi:hypothetical protein
MTWFDINVLSFSGVGIPRTGMGTPRMMLATSETVTPLFCECVLSCLLSVPFDVPGVRLFSVFIMKF